MERQAKKIKRVEVQKTLTAMEPQSWVEFTPSEAEETSIRSAVTRLHDSTPNRYTVNKTGNTVKVTRLL